jgi:putative ABC transport system permease protein
MLASLSLARRRFLHNSVLLVCLGLGMVAATVLFCTVPVFASSVSDIGLQQDLHNSDAVTRDIEVGAQLSSVNAQAVQAAEPEQARLVSQYLGPLVGAGHRVLSSDKLLLQMAGSQHFDIGSALPVEARYLAYDYQSAAAHMSLKAGTLPDQGAQPAVLITEEMAQVVHLQVGDTLVLVPFGDHARQFPLQVSGIWAPKDPNDDYWYGRRFTSDQGPNQPTLFPLLVSSKTFFAQLSGVPNLSMSALWDYPLQTEQIRSATLNQTIAALTRFSSEITNYLLPITSIQQAQVNTSLDQVLGDYQHRLDLLALPLYVVVVQVLGLVLLYIVIVSGLLVERQAGEIATLKSRGASGAQVLGLYVAQGAALAALAVVLGPVLAAFLTHWLVFQLLPAGTANAVSSGYLEAGALTGSVFLTSALAGVLSLGALTLAMLRAARLDVLAFRRELTRSAHRPFWQRYYLDVGLAVLCVAGYVDLNYFGTTRVRALLGNGVSADPLLLLAPGLLLLAGSLLALRLFPLLITAGAHLVARGRGATGLLALIQIARSPLHYTRLVLLLMLAVGLGLFTLTFSASLSQSVVDRAGYQAGADLRLVESPLNATPAAFEQAQQLAALPGVQAISAARRATAQMPGARSATLGLLAIDPATFAGVASWRSDYAAQPLDALMRLLSEHALPASALDARNFTTPPTVYALVSQSFLDASKLAVGDSFSASPSDAVFTRMQFRIGAVVKNFPTLFDRAGAGYFIIDLHDYLGIVNGANGNNLYGPGEFWLRTTETPAALSQLRQVVAQPSSGFLSIVDRRALQAASEQNPLQAGLRGVLLLGVCAAAGLAVLGSLLYSGLTARQRATQFAVLRTLGASSGQLVRLLLGEQVALYLFGLVAGTALGAVLATATLPYLEFGAGQGDAAAQSVPPAALTVHWPSVAIFYGVLALACVLVLLWMARYAERLGLGRTLRLGED